MKRPRPGGSSVRNWSVDDQVTAPCFPVLPARGALPLPRPSRAPRAAPYLPGPSTLHSRALPRPGREASPDPLFECLSAGSPSPSCPVHSLCVPSVTGCSLTTSCLPLRESRGGRDRHLGLSLGHPASSEEYGTRVLRKFAHKRMCKSRLKSDCSCLLPLKGLFSHCRPGLVLLSSHSPLLLSRPEVFWSLAFLRFENRIREYTIYCGTSPGSTL